MRVRTRVCLCVCGGGGGGGGGSFRPMGVGRSMTTDNLLLTTYYEYYTGATYYTPHTTIRAEINGDGSSKMGHSVTGLSTVDASSLSMLAEPAFAPV